MSVILNERAILTFMETNPGVVLFVERTAEAVATHAQVQFDEYFHHVLPAGQDIIFSMDGSKATIGYNARAGHKSERLAAAELAGKLTNPPLQQALDAARNGG